MARVCPAPERTLLGGQALGQHTRVEVRNASGTWIELTDLSNINWVNGWSIDESIDQNVASLVLTLQANHGALSLHPLRADSALNVDDLAAYSPLVFGGRLCRVHTGASVPDATVPSTPWRRVFDGIIDEPASSDNGNTLTVQGRDLGQLLLDKFPEEQRYYSTDAGQTLEVVMQQIVDDSGVAATITTPGGAPPWAIKKFLYDGTISYGEELRNLAQQIGWDLRYRWLEDSPDTNTLELQLYDPDRTNTTAAFTLPPSEYLTVEELKFGDRNVRNVIGIWFHNSLAAGALEYLEVEDAASIAIYGRRYMGLSEQSTSEIDTPTEATLMIEAALSDLSTPLVDHVLTSYDLWFAQLGDLTAFPANDVLYSDDQAFAIVGIRREWANGKGLATFRTRGKPAGAYSDWIRKQGRGPGTGPQVPAPKFTYMLGEESHGGGVSGDGMVWIGTEFEINTREILFWGEEGDDARTPTPDTAINSMALPLTRQEGVDSSADDWKTVVGIATRPFRWRAIRARGVGPNGELGPEWMPPPVQAIDPTPAIGDAKIIAFSVAKGLLDTNILAITPGLLAAGDNWIFIWRNGVQISQIYIGQDTAQKFYPDTFINPNAQYNYEVFVWNNGVSGKHARVKGGLTVPPGVRWAANSPKLVWSSPSYLVELSWTLTGLGTADHVVIELSLDGINFLITNYDSVSAASFSYLDPAIFPKWYRLRVETAANAILAYSSPSFWSGQGVPPSQGLVPPEWAPVPTARIIRSENLSIGIPGLVMGFICATSGAATCAIQKSPDDGTTPWADVYVSGQLSGDTWTAGSVAENTFYRLQSRDAAGGTLTNSASIEWIVI